MSDDKIKVVIDADLEELIPTFLENRVTDLNNLKAALAEGDYETLRSIGHSLKGVGGGYGFERITQLGAAIENFAKENDKDAVSENISELGLYLERVDVVFE